MTAGLKIAEAFQGFSFLTAQLFFLSNQFIPMFNLLLLHAIITNSGGAVLFGTGWTGPHITDRLC